MTETGRTAAQENFSFGEAQAASRRIVFQTGNCFVFPQNLKLFRFPAKPKTVPFPAKTKTVSFSHKTDQNCHCEEGACARRGNL